MPMRNDDLCVVCHKNKAVGHDVCWQCRTPNNLIKSFYDDDTIEWNEELGYRALLLAVMYVGTPQFKEKYDSRVESQKKKWVPKSYADPTNLVSSHEICRRMGIDRNIFFRYVYKLKIEGVRIKRCHYYTKEQSDRLMKEIENAPPKRMYQKRSKNPTPQFDEVC